jgi:hypothetical protein
VGRPDRVGKKNPAGASRRGEVSGIDTARREGGGNSPTARLAAGSPADHDSRRGWSTSLYFRRRRWMTHRELAQIMQDINGKSRGLAHRKDADNDHESLGTSPDAA